MLPACSRTCRASSKKSEYLNSVLWNNKSWLSKCKAKSNREFTSPIKPIYLI